MGEHFIVTLTPWQFVILSPDLSGRRISLGRATRMVSKSFGRPQNDREDYIQLDGKRR